MKWAAVCVLLAGCATVPSAVIVQPDPLSGAPTAYATVFLTDDVSRRIVLSAPVGAPAPIHLTFWAPAGEGACEIALEIAGHRIKSEAATSSVVDTPSGADQTVAFTLPPAVLHRAADNPATVVGCGGPWPLGDDDRAVLRDFMTAVTP